MRNRMWLRIGTGVGGSRRFMVAHAAASYEAALKRIPGGRQVIGSHAHPAFEEGGKTYKYKRFRTMRERLLGGDMFFES
jgi:hypothetical protein